MPPRAAAPSKMAVDAAHRAASRSRSISPIISGPMQVHGRPSVAIVARLGLAHERMGEPALRRATSGRRDSRSAAGPAAGWSQQGLERHPVAGQRPLPKARQPHPLRAERVRAARLCPPPPRPDRVASLAGGVARAARSSRRSHGSARRRIAQARAATVAKIAFDVVEAVAEGQVERRGCRAARRASAVARRRRPWSATRSGRSVQDVLERCRDCRDSAAPAATAAISADRCDEMADAGDLPRLGEQQQIFVGAQVERGDPTAALAAESKAKAGIEAPPFGAIAEHVLVARVEQHWRRGRTARRWRLQRIGDARSREPVGIEPHDLRTGRRRN